MRFLYKEAPTIKGWTLEEIVSIREIMNEVWDYIAYDALEASIGKNSAKTISRSWVVEWVTDASRMETLSRHPDRKALAEKYYALNPKDRGKIDKYAFPHKRFGY